MADEEIAVRLSLRDRLRFSREAQIAAHDIDNIGDQATQANTKLGLMSRTAHGAGRMALKGLAVGAVGAGVALAGIGTMAIKGALEAEDVMAKTDAVIKSTGGAAGITSGHVKTLSEDIMAYSGVSDEAVASTANVLLQFDQIANAGKGPAAVFDRSTKALTDYSAATGKDATGAARMLGRALQDPANSLSALTRLTGGFTDAQELQIQGMVKAGDVVGAQGMILDSFEKKFGGAAAAVGKTAQGSFNILKETVGNSLEEVGAMLLPIATEVMPVLTDALTGIIQAVGPSIGRIAKAIGKVLPPLLKVATPLIEMFADVFILVADALAPVLPILGTVFKNILVALKPALEPLAGALGNAFVTILKAIAPVLPDLAMSFADLVIALTPLIPVAAKLIKLLLQIGGPIISKIAKAISWVAKKVITPVVGFIATAIDKAIGLITGIKDKWDGIIDWFQKIPGRLASVGSGMWDWIKDSFKGAINWIIRGWNGLDFSFDIPNWIPGAPNEVTIGVPDIPELWRGGTVTKGGLASVGEHGPEIVVLPPAASVIPLAMTGTDGVGGGNLGWPESFQVVVDRRVIAEVTLDGVRDKDARL